MGIVIGIIAFFVTFPLAAWLLFLVLFRVLLKSKKKSFLLSVDVAAVFFAVSFWIKLSVIWHHQSFLWLLCLYLLLFLATAGLQFVFTDEIKWMKALKMMWRSSFLIFFLLSESMAIIGVFMYIMNQM
ncbi:MULTISPECIES: DUF3397 family protein [Aeribacillus]|jgi:Protein of unknown function (DUF3397)|uniref:DUF3397 domain-containing protein n=1 Tax=Aeribacillus pallidus TaxID=33936 RepID=A0A163XN46_9BACI|nr:MULTISPECIES: DUF3397 family protein [Aeribacillus]KZM52623.1 hypothetical protein A3Q35_03390 [Aeribacillus pallidus]KZN95770.1 hypothetical protein AZI98_11890 [Aeribacillus pallidus]MED0649031.1 DUF3397 family protein [Aeribacillus composti]MED0703705.1 DUF3397 family protein [Aeribacillus composti]MED1441638.1 DUF3397 family protein [Aeribacillus composti]